MLEALWQELDAAFGIELSESKCGVQDFLKRRNPAWNLVGRVHFNIAENRKDADAPFAFLATYTTRLSAQAKAQHLPLGQALREYAGAANKERLLSLLVPVQRASETCPWLKAMVDAGEIFHPLRWTPREALQLLRDVPHLESAGVVVRMPAAWRANRPPRPRVTGSVEPNRRRVWDRTRCYQSTGIETRFTNLMEPEARSRPVFAFHRPETLAEWLMDESKKPGSTLRARLKHMPPLGRTATPGCAEGDVSHSWP